MCAIGNGLALSKLRPFVSTFFIFSDYCKPAVRLSAIMEVPVIYIFTHDSIGVGEDGPTHQPIEQLIALRAVPGLIVLRPADANEVMEAYKYVMQLHHEPVAHGPDPAESADHRPHQVRAASGVTKGAYILADAKDGKPDVILMATGSEVDMILKAYEKLVAEGVKAPPGQHALVGDFRAPIAGISR